MRIRGGGNMLAFSSTGKDGSATTCHDLPSQSGQRTIIDMDGAEGTELVVDHCRGRR